MSVLVSVIIPVFNGEQYFNASIEALCSQTYKNWECIIVNDGSTDSTMLLSEKYCEKDSRFKVIHTENQGPGLARNAGLDIALGEYIWFVDIDDIVEFDGLAKMIDIAQKHKADVVAGLYYRLSKDKKELVGQNFEEGIISRSTPNEIEKYNKVKTSSLFGYLWNKIYNRDFIVQNKIKFDDVRSLNLEDTLFNLKVFSKNPVYYLCTSAVYNYNIINISYTRRAEPDILSKNIMLIKTYYEYLVKNSVLEENLDLAVALTARVFCWTLVKNIPYEGLSYKKLYNDIKVFLKEDSFVFLINNKRSIKMLFSISSVAQSLFYSFCFFMLRIRFKITLAFFFFITYPVMKKYIAAALK